MNLRRRDVVSESTPNSNHHRTTQTSRRAYNTLSSSSSSSSSLPYYAYNDGTSGAIAYEEELNHHRQTSSSAVPKRDGGLSYFFSGFAAGEDMVPLIHVLRETLHPRPRDGHHRLRATSSEHHNTSATLRNSSQRRRPTSHTSLSSSTHVAPSTRPFNKYECVSLEATKEQCTHAAKTALLFSVESADSVDAATELYCAPEIQDLLQPPHRHNGNGGRQQLNGRHGAAAAHRPSSFFLSEKVILKKARDSLRQYQQEREAAKRQRQNGTMQEASQAPLELALSLLEQAPVTPHTQALYLEALSFTTQWEKVMQVLMNGLTPSAWSELDVAMGMQCLRRAAAAATAGSGAAEPQAEVETSQAERRAGIRAHTIARALHEAEQNQTDADGPEKKRSGHKSAEGLATCPLRLLRLARAHQISFSTPSAVNDALGTIGHLSRAAGPSSSLWQEACQIVDEFLFPLEDTTKTESGTADASHSPVVKPNVVTIYQLCRAMPTSEWSRTLAYTQALLAHYHLPVGEDMATMEQLLRVCMAGGRWEEALQLLRTQAHNRQPTVAAQEGESSTTTTANNGSILGYRAPFFLSLVQFFNEHLPSSRETQSLFAQAFAPNASSSSEAFQLSKFYNEDVVLRAYNSLLQHSKTVEEAERFAYSILTSQAADAGASSSAKEDFAKTFLKKDDARLENESYARLTQLYATAGQWKEAVHAFQMLCGPTSPATPSTATSSAETPLRRARARTFLPTAQLHDTVQYAMEQAPLPGPSWQASLDIFMHLSEELQVPVSPVAFRCVVKISSRQNAGEVAQKLFQYVIRQGVH